MLARARGVLTSDIALSEGIDDSEAQRLLDVNLGYQDPEPGDEKHHAEAPEEPAFQTLYRLEEEERAAKIAAKQAARAAREAAAETRKGGEDSSRDTDSSSDSSNGSLPEI